MLKILAALALVFPGDVAAFVNTQRNFGRSLRRTKSPMSAIAFEKYHGLGNDFILVDNRGKSEPMMSPEEAAKMCDRNFGVGGDGVIFAMDPVNGDGANWKMRIYNSDGSEPEMCGNGIRCMAKYIAKLDDVAAGEEVEYIIETGAGLIKPVIRADGLVKVDMGFPVLEGSKVPTTLAPTQEGGVVVDSPITVAGKEWLATCIGMGNPHCVVFVDDVAALDLAAVGPPFETHPAFPAKVNTEFVEVRSPAHLVMKVWERGAGSTLACGTGACALTVAAILAGKTTERTCVVTLPGGDLEIEWRESDGRIFMTGPAQVVFGGVYGPR